MGGGEGGSAQGEFEFDFEVEVEVEVEFEFLRWFAVVDSTLFWVSGFGWLDPRYIQHRILHLQRPLSIPIRVCCCCVK